jgi:hypothetical protein
LKILQEASPGAQTASLERMMYDLERQARQAISEWNRLRGGKADQEIAQERAQQRATLKEINELDKYLITVREQLIRRFGRLLFIRDASLRLQVIETIDRLEATSVAVRQRHTVATRTPKSEKKIAKDLLEEFLVMAIVTWCQATKERPTRGITPDEEEPSGPCSAFLNSVAQPLIKHMNADDREPVLLTGWRTVYKRVRKILPRLEPDLGERILGFDIRIEKAKKRKQRQGSGAK